MKIFSKTLCGDVREFWYHFDSRKGGISSMLTFETVFMDCWGELQDYGDSLQKGNEGDC